MTSSETTPTRWTPSYPLALALAAFTVAALSLCWPMLTGQFLVGPASDQYSAGYAYREFLADYVRTHRAIPPWNPYLFGGIAFVGGTHGNVFHPATWLQWAFATDTGMNLGFLLHLVLAGLSLYLLLRALGASWSGAVVGGLAYELTGILASLVKPGHDGKLYASAIAPLLFLGLLRGIRHGRLGGFVLVAFVTGIAILGHFQIAYYMLVAGGVWALWLALADPERPAGARWPVALGASLGAVLIGIGISAVQALPLLDYIPFSPRAEGGPSGGWDYATQFAMPIAELMTTVLPQFNGVLEHYWGDNFFKLHTEYVGAIVLLLAAAGVGDRSRGSLRWILVGIAVLFLLVAFGGHTPFYRLWYEVMPMMKKVRAAGMAFYLPAMIAAIFAGFGADRLLEGRVTARWVWTGGAIIGALALLGAVGALQPVTEAMADPRVLDRAVANADALRAGSLRLLVMIALGVAAMWAVVTGRLRGAGAAAALGAVLVADNWSVDRQFFDFSPPARVLYAEDDLVRAMRATEGPYRVLDPWGASVYEHAILMTHRVPQVFGYHGQESRFYDELWGGKGIYRNQINPNLWDLFAVRYVLLPEPQQVPGLRQVAGPVQTAQGGTGYLYALESAPPYARVVGAAAKLPDSVMVATVTDQRFPVSDVVLFPDTASVNPPPLPNGQVPARPAVTAKVTTWAPGVMEFALEGAAATPTWLLIGESWFKDWRATVDGAPATVRRADHAAMAVELPPGAKQVRLWFDSPAYHRGKMLSLASLLLAGLGAVGAVILQRRRADG